MKRWRNNKPSLLEGYDISEIANCNPSAVITLKRCGLDPDRNFLKAPECECGCGGKANIILYNEDDVLDFCEMMCLENDECNYCGVFVVMEDESLLMAIKLKMVLITLEEIIVIRNILEKLLKRLNCTAMG